MIARSAEAVRAFVLEQVAESLSAKGLTPVATPTDYDLLSEGVIDSFGIIELIGAIEQHFGVTLDFEDVDPDTVTVLGPLSEHVATLVKHA
jgi:acyl carrier protein